jgi:hypothetical protein
MNYYNIEYSPVKKDNKYQRINYNKKIKIYGSRVIKNLIPNNVSNKTIYKNY